MKWRPADEAGAKWLATPGKEWHLSYVTFAPNTARQDERGWRETKKVDAKLIQLRHSRRKNWS
ncbi:hypothetical protein [Pararhizobium sp. LjRoot255]|uniref:hypothetical protein n=1 Tax=Pararhizobium sp. LjRoot255 TaxID=3342298 RepID=UPI003F4F4437